MDSRHKRKALIGLSTGLLLQFMGGWALIHHVNESGAATPMVTAPVVIALIMMIVAIPLYLWGCAALAKGKGYSTAILLTFILGGLFPMVVLLALPDKNRHQRRRRS